MVLLDESTSEQERPGVDVVLALHRAVRDALAGQADAERASAQRRYMKSAMPFYGVAMPQVRRAVNALAADRAYRLEPAEWSRAVRLLWDEAGHREERYAALSLARHRLYRAQAQRVAALGLYEHVVRTGAWWDLVDEAAHLVGGVLATHRAEVTPIIADFSRDPDRWVRRVAILSQLDHREVTDTDLLMDCIEANLSDDDVFIRKAIGWSLRQHARSDPEWVRFVVTLLGERLSPLSRREALKHLA